MVVLLLLRLISSLLLQWNTDVYLFIYLLLYTTLPFYPINDQLVTCTWSNSGIFDDPINRRTK